MYLFMTLIITLYGIYPEVGLLVHMVFPVFNYLMNLYTVFITTINLYPSFIFKG
jgi:hypothetical protein